MRSSVRRSSAGRVALDRRGEVQRVLHVARGMLGRHVQRVEAVPLVLDLGTFDDREAHAREDVFHAIAHDGERMAVAERAASRPGSVTSTASRRRRGGRGRSGTRPSALRSPASARWRSGRCSSSGRAGRWRSAASTTRPRCSCGRGTCRGPPARRAATRAGASSASNAAICAWTESVVGEVMRTTVVRSRVSRESIVSQSRLSLVDASLSTGD